MALATLETVEKFELIAGDIDCGVSKRVPMSTTTSITSQSLRPDGCEDVICRVCASAVRPIVFTPFP